MPAPMSLQNKRVSAFSSLPHLLGHPQRPSRLSAMIELAQGTRQYPGLAGHGLQYPNHKTDAAAGARSAG